LRCTLATFLGMSLWSISGCGDSAAEVPLSGTVRTTDGMPVTEGQLVLIPDPFDKDQPQAGATLADDGAFTCRSFAGRNGVLPGAYKVILQFPSGKGAVNSLSRSFAKYTSFETTPLRLEVPETGLTDVLLELEESGPQ
jgi:hypothetical protein